VFRTAVLLTFIAAIPGIADPAYNTPIDRAFGKLYNFDFAGTHRIIDEQIAARPEDPLGYAVRASALLFEELDRLQILESEFFADDKRIAEKKKLQPDPRIRAGFYASIEQAQKRAQARLSAVPDDRDALFTLCLTGGLTTDYTSLIEKKQLSSLSFARQSQRYAVRLQKLEPRYYDAYLSTGVTEYILGSLPFFIRWFVRFDDASGDKHKAIQNLELVARSGRYLKGFAKVLLALVYLREKRPEESRRFLAELAVEYPRNPLIQKELVKVSQLLQPAR
jgi:hypothetical protein